MSNLKITIIGAGSFYFTLCYVNDICLTPNLHGSTVSLCDIDEEKLDNTYRACKRFVEELGVDLKFEKTLNRRESLKGSSFVVNTALGDGGRRLTEGWAIAEKHGVKWGGSYHILYDEPFWLNYYQFKLNESITEDMLELCPDAWHLLVANPVITLTTYLQRRYPQSKMVGLCHGYGEAYAIADVLGLDKDKFTFEVAGANHFIFITQCYYEGRDVFAMIDEWLETKASEYWKTHTEGIMGKKKMDLYKRHGVIPVGDTASASGASWPWWYHADAETESQFGIDSKEHRRWWLEDVAGGMISGTARYKKLAQSESIVESLKSIGLFHTKPSGELVVPIIESITHDIPRVLITNILNSNEFVPGIPRDFQVEIPTLISRRGIQGIETAGLPKSIIAHLLRDRVAPIELELEAYNQGSRDLLVELLLTDKWITSMRHANELIDEIFSLPYHKELREHYK